MAWGSASLIPTLLLSLFEPAQASTPEPEPAAAPETESTERVMLGIVEGDPVFDRPDLASSMEAHLAGSGFAVEVYPLAEGSPRSRTTWAADTAALSDVHAVFWIEPSGPGHRLYLLEPQSRELWARALPPTEEPEVAVEQLGIMLRSLTTHLEPGGAGWESAPLPESVETAPDEPPASAPPTPAPAPRPEPPAPKPRLGPWLGLEVGYTGSNLDDRAPWQHGVGGFFDVELRVGAFLRWGAAYVQPDTRNVVVPTKLRRLPLTLSTGYRFRERWRMRAELSVTLVAEVFWWTSEDTPAARGVSGTQGRLALAPGAGVRWRVWRGLGIYVRGRADLWVINLDLEAAVTPPASVLSAHPVAGVAEAGLGYVF